MLQPHPGRPPLWAAGIALALLAIGFNRRRASPIGVRHVPQLTAKPWNYT
jgi:hypothetical protein